MDELFLAFVLAPGLACILGATGLARVSPPRGGHLAWRAAPLGFGVLVLALTAWATHEDGHYYGSAALLLAPFGGMLLILGLGPLIPWLLESLRQGAVRLPPPLRLATRVRSTAGVALTTTATTFAIAVLIIAVARIAQDRADYYPRARPATLQVSVYSEDAAIVRTALQRELPGIPIAQSDTVFGPRHFAADFGQEYTELGYLLGDQALLRYLTGDPSTPYDENTAVVVTADDIEATSVNIRYDTPQTVRTVPAIAARPADPRIDGIFIPTKIARDLGFRPEPSELIIDPSLHRTTAAEQDRIDERLGEIASSYVERGFQPSRTWLSAFAVGLLLALGGALTGGFRATRLEQRLSGGSATRLRSLVATRVGMGALCGTVLGAISGCTLGLLLVWPLTTSGDWEPLPRSPFETPWALIAALVVGLPLLAAALAAIPRRTKGDS